MEFLLRKIPNDYDYKNNYLKNNAQKIETIFFGSSHTFRGVNPIFFSGNSFNASHISQSIDLDYKILEKNSDKFNNLKFIFIPIDYFTLVGRTSTGVENWRVKNYNIYYKLNLSLNPIYYFETFSFSFKQNFLRIKNYYVHNISNITCDELGFGIEEKTNIDLLETGIKNAKRHTKKNKKYFDDSIETLTNFINFSEKKNIKIVFYTSPAYYTYVENLDSLQLYNTISTIDSISKIHSNTFYFNLLNNKTFTKEDFRDADHLNKNGAEKLTKILDSIKTNIEHYI